MLMWLLVPLIGALVSWLAVKQLRNALFPELAQGGGGRGSRGSELIIGFFHPYCHSGGGGERVLWCGIQALLKSAPALMSDDRRVRIVVYTGDVGVSATDILARVKDRFNITFPSDDAVEFVYLHGRNRIEAARYPRLTMLGQSIGSVLLAWEALRKRRPDVFIDTTGFAFTYPVAAFARCKVGCYTHYPTITSDMLQRVSERRPTYNNDSGVANSAMKSALKLWYYRMFAAMYRKAGGYADVVMVNSSWTGAHIEELWGAQRKPTVVFPPCNTKHLTGAPLGARARMILSVGQFRPEKDHRLQLDAFKALRDMGERFSDVKLVLLGGCRGADDEALVEGLKRRVAELKLGDSVEFRTNAPFKTLLRLLGKALIGIHTMWNEHFGIGIVEMMAAGEVVVAHNTGGPKADIVVPYEGETTGFLASTAKEYAETLAKVLDSAAATPGALAEVGGGDSSGDDGGDDNADESGDEAAAGATADALKSGGAVEEKSRDSDGDGDGSDGGSDSDGDSGGGATGGAAARSSRAASDAPGGAHLNVLDIAQAARESAQRFSDEEFAIHWFAPMARLVRLTQRRKDD